MNRAENKRVQSRIKYRKHILCYKHIPSDCNKKISPAPIRITIENLSYSGLGILSTRDLSKKDILIFNLENSSEKKEVILEVMWCHYSSGQYVAGLKFINLTRETILFIDKLIKKPRIKKYHS